MFRSTMMGLGLLGVSTVSADSKTQEIAPGVFMPRVNLGTCCGSKPLVGMPSWLGAGGTGIDTAYDYGKQVPGGLQSDVAEVLASTGTPRENVFLTTKIPAGYGIRPSDCATATAESALAQVEENLKELKVKYVDLVLLHAPCIFGGDAANAKLYAGLELALAQNLTRAIGVSNYNVAQLTALLKTAKVVPAVNQCDMSVSKHDDSTIAFSQAHNITYEAFEAMNGCPFTSPVLGAIAKNHGVEVPQVCLRYVLQRGCVMAVGTGTDASKVQGYAESDLDLFGFELTAEEMVTLGKIAK